MFLLLVSLTLMSDKGSAAAKRASPTNRDKRTPPNKGGSSNKRNSRNSNRVRGYDENKYDSTLATIG
jgi:hypothetical protein